MSKRTTIHGKGLTPFPTQGFLLLLAALALLSSGCNKNDSSATGGTDMTETAAAVPGMRKAWGLHVLSQPGSSFHVEYSDKTSVVDMATVGRTLLGVTEDHRIFLFKDSPELRAKLIPGKYVLFQGLDLRKVDALAVDPATGNLVVGTETPSLREALKSANIQFQAPVDFSGMFHQSLAQAPATEEPPVERRRQVAQFLTSPQRWWDWIEPTAHASFTNSDVEGEVELSDSDFANWKCHYHYTLNPDHSFNIDTTLVREANGLDVDMHVKGRVSRFDLNSSIVFTNQGPAIERFVTKDLHGDGNLDWTIKTSEVKTPMNEVRLKLPGKLTVPLVEFTDLPMSLQISEALLFHPAFTGKEQVAKGGFHVAYSGSEGLKVENSIMQADGSAQADSGIDQTVAFSPYSAFGLVLAVAAPRVELRMGAEEIWDMAKVAIPSSLAESLSDVLLKNTIAGQWLNKRVGNPLSVEGAAYFQVVVSTTAAHSGMLSLVPCQQFTMVAKGQVGVDAEWLGANTNWPAKEVFSKELSRRQPDAPICGGAHGG